jgi:hypothetical protein
MGDIRPALNSLESDDIEKVCAESILDMHATVVVKRWLRYAVKIHGGEGGAISELVGVDEKQAQKDKALNLLSQHHVDFDPNSDEAKRVLRKIDMRIMPIIWFMYLLQLMDKNSLSFANIMGIKASYLTVPSKAIWTKLTRYMHSGGRALDRLTVQLAWIHRLVRMIVQGYYAS